jgi:tetratricopeptide (TPR) repeat protein
MKRFHRLAGVVLAGAAWAACAQAPAQTPKPATSDAAADKAAAAEVPVSALDSELFYELLLGELNSRSGEPGTGFSLILDAARKSKDPQVYQRAVDIALQSRSGEAALLAARSWQEALPQSREANGYLLQILIALNRIPETLEPLKQALTTGPVAERSLQISLVPRQYARAGDKKAAAAVVEQALTSYTAQPATAAAAWTAIGQTRVAAGDPTGALDAARKAQAADPRAEGPALLGLQLMDAKQPLAEPLVTRYLESGPASPDLRMAYARGLLDMRRETEATQQLQTVVRERPEFAQAWLVLGALQVQDNQFDDGEKSLKRYVELAASMPAEERKRGLDQAYLSLAQIAEKRRDYAGAEAWIARIDNAQDMVSAQLRRASILARQGKLEEGRALIRGLPERNPGDARTKLMAEVQLLRDNKQYRAAFEVAGKAAAADPKDMDLLYDQAMLAEKMGDLDEMERLIRQVVAIKPDYHHAYNALGYSLAERNIRLPEARQLIQKALEYAPGDPFISDSLGWVEFRMGNQQEAARILEAAFKTKPDPEIAAHLGEVLWSLGQRDKAAAIWKEGLLLNGDNETLNETLKRLRVKL